MSSAESPSWDTESSSSTDRSMLAVAACSVLLAGIMVFGTPMFAVGADEPAALASSVADDAANETAKEEVSTLSPHAATIAEYSTISQSEDTRRTTNLVLAAEAIDGYEIKPGETFSFNEVVGDSGVDERYEVAAILTDEGVAEGRGGGVCQVSTALYIAALKADLAVTERHPHSMACDYAPFGLDATVAFGIKDLKIRNDGQYSVIIHASAKGQSVSIEIEGNPLEEGLSIEAQSVVINYEQRRGLIPDDGSGGDYDEDGYIDDAYIHPTTEYVTESYRVYYRDGVKIEQEYLSTDTYQEAR